MMKYLYSIIVDLSSSHLSPPSSLCSISMCFLLRFHNILLLLLPPLLYCFFPIIFMSLLSSQHVSSFLFHHLHHVQLSMNFLLCFQFSPYLSFLYFYPSFF
uniref:Uncharacterized protein n=1 Tax=Cacopsylla melanoneura TaxID=428564 RepID=A0A8D9FJQ3_9HEMI